MKCYFENLHQSTPQADPHWPSHKIWLIVVDQCGDENLTSKMNAKLLTCPLDEIRVYNYYHYHAIENNNKKMYPGGLACWSTTLG